jgi:signal transduction histidine kinase
MSVRRRLIMGSLIEFVVFLAIILGILYATGVADQRDDQVRLSLRRLTQAQAVAKYSSLEVDRADDLIISGGKTFEPTDYNARVKNAFAQWETSLRENINILGNSELGDRQRSELMRVQAIRRNYTFIGSSVDQAIALTQQGNYPQAVALAVTAQNSYRGTFVPGLESVTAVEQANAAVADIQSKDASNTARVVPIVMAPIGLIIFAVISFLLIRDVSRSVAVLKDGAAQFGNGDLDIVIDTGRRDELQEVAMAFNRMAAALKLTTEELRQYAHTVSHDLKGPLSSVVMASDLLVDEVRSRPDLQKEGGLPLVDMATLVRDNAARTLDLVDELLELAEAGQVPKSVSTVVVSRTVSQILEERAADLESKSFAVEAPDDLGIILANPAHIYQLFSNLIANAIKFTAKENPVIEISYPGKDETGAHRYVLRDNGPGIEPEDLDHLFEPFYRGEEGGTGIGLATVQKIVGVYGGTISVRTEGGAVFEFTLRDWAKEVPED